MRVILAKTAGFCYGVERAVALAHETAKAHGGAMLGSVIHNANVVAELEREGMRLIASPEEAAAGETVLIRSHGESREVLERYHRFFVRSGARLSEADQARLRERARSIVQQQVIPARAARIRCEREEAFLGDGDAVAHGTEFHVRSLPRALAVLA